MLPTPDDPHTSGLETVSESDSDQHLLVDSLDNVLSRPVSWRRRLFFSTLLLTLGVLLVVTFWRGFVPAIQRSLIAAINTPVPLTPTPTLAVAGQVGATFHLVGGVHAHSFIAASATAVWVHDGPSGTVTRIDPTTNTVVAQLALGGTDGGQIAIEPQAVWVTNGTTGVVSRIDPESNHVTATIQLSPGVGLLTLSPGTLWAINIPQHTVSKIDEQTNRVVATLSVPPLPIGLTYGAGSIWICDRHDGAAGVLRLDPHTDQILAQIDVSGNRGLWCNGDLQVTAEGVWVPLFDTVSPLRQHLVARIDPATNKVTNLIGLGADMNPSMAADAHGVWVIDALTGLYRIDPHTKQVVAKVPLPGGDCIAIGAGTLWLTRTSDNTVVRITGV
jgi:DNA-binding beta-propeller fold protein YncE